jgi:hypothetical protein
MAAENDNDSTFKPGRRLCPDGSCIGIIGDDGQCSICGTSTTGAVGSPASEPADFQDDTDVERTEPGLDESPSDFNANRRLCSDDECIGVIGEDNRCRVCGKPEAR